MNDASAPSGSRADAGRRTVLSPDQARALARGIAEASDQVDAMIEQLGDIVALVRGDDGRATVPGARGAAAPDPRPRRRTDRDDDRARYDGDRRI